MARRLAGLTQCVLYLVLQMAELFLTDCPAIDLLDYGDHTGCTALLAEAGIEHEVDDNYSDTYSAYGLWPE